MSSALQRSKVKHKSIQRQIARPKTIFFLQNVTLNYSSDVEQHWLTLALYVTRLHSLVPVVCSC